MRILENLIGFLNIGVGTFAIYCIVNKRFDKTGSLGAGVIGILMITSALLISIK